MVTGAIGPNLHEGSRSEIIADYLLSSWGTVTPVRRQDDHGLDLYCTLIERAGQRAFVTDYYSVQVKSDCDPYVFETRDSVQWLVQNPNPVFLACVDKRQGEMRIHHLLPRFLIAIQQIPASLTLTPSDSSEGRCLSSLDDLSNLSLSAPILRITLADSLIESTMQRYRDILRHWIRIDKHNCDWRTAGILRFNMPFKYTTNVEPDEAWVEYGNLKPDEGQTAHAVEQLVECLDCVGCQLLERRDRKTVLYAAMLLRQLRNEYPSAFPPGSRWHFTHGTNLESAFRADFNAGHHPNDKDWREAVESADEQLSQLPEVSAYLRSQS